ncbi:prealbumin-like fold domain-containing protein [Capnocytophaga canis]|uniref:Lipoprotein n=1 Tax=Capnocytophaga canis TaxID=1848903 RepID=A0A0B7IUV8_9FLAO|nr:prealbumin-like fold domain-containing protein [Capnocytophaga canis]CEN53698.1 exported hypothetical protein [Capnocytophaga canis]
MRKLLLTLLIAGGTLVGCKKDETLKEVTIQVAYSSQTAKVLNKKFLDPIPGVEVILYGNKEDFENGNNKIASLVTDAKGEVTFKNLEEKEYFFFAKNDFCMMNIQDVISEENNVTVKAGYFPTHVITLMDQVLVVDLINRLDKSVYVGIDYLSKDKGLLLKGEVKQLFLIPRSESTGLNYLEHTIQLYNTVDDNFGFKTIPISGNTNCQVVPIYIEE